MALLPPAVAARARTGPRGAASLSWQATCRPKDVKAAKPGSPAAARHPIDRRRQNMTLGRHSRRVFLRAGMAWLALAAAPAALAKKNGDENPGKGKGNAGKGNSGAGGAPEAVAASLTAASIHGMLGANVGVVHVGAKPLPPGIRKNLARGKPLPPGIAKQMVPGPLLVKLPKVDGHDWLRVGTTLVLVAAATLIVKEIIENVFD
jgi:hypothetical protein